MGSLEFAGWWKQPHMVWIMWGAATWWQRIRTLVCCAYGLSRKRDMCMNGRRVPLIFKMLMNLMDRLWLGLRGLGPCNPFYSQMGPQMGPSCQWGPTQWTDNGPIQSESWLVHTLHPDSHWTASCKAPMGQCDGGPQQWNLCLMRWTSSANKTLSKLLTHMPSGPQPHESGSFRPAWPIKFNQS